MTGPVQLFDNKTLRFTGTAAAVANPSPLISLYRGALMVISGLAAETIEVRGTVGNDGTPVETGPIQVQATDGTTSAAAALGNGTYYFDILFEKLKITKSAGANDVTITIYLRS